MSKVEEVLDAQVQRLQDHNRNLQERLKASQQEVDQFRALADELTTCCGWVGDKPERKVELEMALREIAEEMRGAHDGGCVLPVQAILRRVGMTTAMSETMNSQIRHLQERLKASEAEVERLRSDLALLGPVTTPLSGQDCASCGRACCADWTYCPSCGAQERRPGEMSLATPRGRS